MEARRVNEYRRHGCNFSGKLVLVEYTEDMNNDSRSGTWNSHIVYDYVDKAEALVKQKYGTPVRVLLAIPDYVCIVE